MSGVRSRSAALELSSFEVFVDKDISEIKRILLDFPFQKMIISDGTKAWLGLLSESVKEQLPKKMFFPTFTWKKANLPVELYIRENNGKYFLYSSDGCFCEKVESTEKLPFRKIANINGLYFECKDDVWCLKSYDPMIVINEMK